MTAKYTVENSGPKIEAFLRPLLQNAGLDVEFAITAGRSPYPKIDNHSIAVLFSGQDVDVLLSNRAELLLAIEHLTVEVLRMSSDEHALLCFDANDHRLMRIEELRLSAQMAAERVNKSHMPFQFGPMNSRERRVLHLALSEYPELRSESNGAGPQRAVVVYPAGMKSASLPAPVQRRRR